MVSIIIPTYNRCQQLNRTIHSLTELNTPSDLFEIIIVDNGSTDTTKEIIQKFQVENNHISIRYFYDDTPGLLTGRHKGAGEAKGEILTFIDDDVFVSPEWLNNINKIVNEQTDISLITGPNLPFYESYPPSWLAHFWTGTPYGGKKCGWLSLLDLGPEEKQIDPGYVWGLNFTIRKQDFNELGAFNPDNIPVEYQMFQGDGETGLTTKAKAQGKKALYHPGVLLYHQIPASRLTFEYFDKRAFYQGVCNSFTTLRKLYFVEAAPNTPKKNKPLRQRFFVCTKNYIQFVFRNRKKEEEMITILKARFIQKENDGYAFHQKAFNTNQQVREWVLKPNYFNYKLPE